MGSPRVMGYGSWKSPISSELIVSKTIRLGQPLVVGADVYWLEGRPSEQGRVVIVRRDVDGTITDVNPPPYSARTRVHEYGGGCFAVHEGTVYFSNFADQRLYCVEPGGVPHPITPQAALRYADGTIDATGEVMICVREDHRVPGGEARNTIVRITLAGDSNGGQVIVSGNDFYATPRLSPDGAQLSWLTWNHPRMPWDGTELWVAPVNEDGTLGAAQQVAGGETESIFQPAWSPDGMLYFVSDRTGWWNLYRRQKGEVEALTALEAEFGLPQWVFGMAIYDFASSSEIVCTYTRDGSWYLARLNTETRVLETFDVPYTSITAPQAGPGGWVLRAGSATEAAAIVRCDPESGVCETLRRSSDVPIAEAYLSTPEPLDFPTADEQTAHALFYPPKNEEYVAPEGERPPLVVVIHGGPTGAASSTLNLSLQYWTSRGFAVLDVNYRGSTGYGRAYREQLRGQWGVADVADCVHGARALVARGLVDEEHLVIRGGSAGGYTTLCALTFYEVFKAGASYYGVADLTALAEDTHKFESRYLDGLVGPYPEQRALYEARSPIHHTARLACPVIFFQGLEDAVVPPDQAECMVAALREKGVPVAYVPFEGEQHGFRLAENIKRALDAELYFYARVFGFVLPTPVEPVLIMNLDG